MDRIRQFLYQNLEVGPIPNQKGFDCFEINYIIKSES